MELQYIRVVRGSLLSLFKHFGATQTLVLIVPELIRHTRLTRLIYPILGKCVLRVRKGQVSFLIRPFSHDLGIFHEIWGAEVYLPKLAGNSLGVNTIVDVGAHIGLFSLYALHVLGALKIVCVEPDPENFKLLWKNISINNRKAFWLVRAALAGQPGVRRLFLSVDNSGGHSFHGSSGACEVVALTLSDLFLVSKISECDMLKMDCEGAEMEIFQETPDNILRRIRVICFEYHLGRYTPEVLKRIQDKLARCGFEVDAKASTDTLGLVYAVRRQNAFTKPAQIIS